MSYTSLFISAVSNEFGNYREPLRSYYTRPNVAVKIQEDFIPTGTETLEKLDEYLRSCTAVIHLTGQSTGALAQQLSVEVLKVKYPDIQERMPQLREAFEGNQQYSYTQWEAYLATYHRKPLFIAAPEDSAVKDARFQHDEAQVQSQQKHLERLRAMGRYPDFRFANADILVARLATSKLAELVFRAGDKQPIKLPFTSLGTLFKGRTDAMQQVRDSLDQSSQKGNTSALVSTALSGLGGIGKTRLAVEYAWEYRHQYNALLFVLAESPEALRSNLAALCAPRILDLPEHKAMDEEVKIAAVERWLQQHDGWLLILDNVDNDEAAIEVERMLACLQGGHVIITSRLSRFSRQVDRLDLGFLPEDAAIDFLLERTDNERRKMPEDREAATRIVQELDHLALALEQAGAYICTNHLTLAGYEKVWHDSHEKVIEWSDAQQMQYPKSVAVTWITSFDELSEPARRLLYNLAWLSPEPIPESLLEVAVPGRDEEDNLGLLAELARYSLAARSKDKSVFSIHRLVQDVTRTMLENDTELRDEILTETVRWLDNAFVGDPYEVRDWPTLEPLYPHAMSIASYVGQTEMAIQSGLLMLRLASLLRSKGRFREAEPLNRRVLEIHEQHHGMDHPEVATDLNNLGILLYDLSRFSDAEPILRRALKIGEQHFGKDDPVVATYLNNLVNLMLSTDRLTEAEPLMRRALEINKKTFGEDHPSVVSGLNNLAWLLQSTGRYSEAEPLIRRGLQIAERSLGKDHPDVAISLNHLTWLLQATGRFPEAEELMLRALKIHEQSLGMDHPSVATDLNYLASLLQETDRITEAEPLLRRALKIDEQSLGMDHPSVATDLNYLASLLQETDRTTEAEPLLRRALKIDEHFFGGNHPNVAMRLNNLAQFLIDTDRPDEADTLLERSLKITSNSPEGSARCDNTSE